MTDQFCRHLEQIVALGPTAYLVADRAGRIHFACQHSASLFQYERDAICRMNVRAMLAPSPQQFAPLDTGVDIAVTSDDCETLLGGNGSNGFQMIWGRKQNGELFPVRVASISLTGEAQELFGLSIHDSSAQHRFEESLRDQMELFRSILDNSDSAIFVKEISGRYVHVNAYFERLFALKRSQIIGHTDLEIFPERIAKQFRQNDLQVASSQQVLSLEEEVPHTEGTRTFLSVKFPIRNTRGEVAYIGGISTDVTPLKRSQETLSEHKDHLEAVLDSNANGILSFNEQDELMYANEAARELLQLTEDDGRELCPLLEQLRTSGRDCLELLVTRDDETALPCEARMKHFRMVDGHKGTVITIRDLYDRKRREQAENEINSAVAVQRRLYSQAPPSYAGYEIAGELLPAESLSGDYLDYIPLGENKLAVVVADVCGHGFGPALEMVETRAYLRSQLKQLHRKPADVMTMINQQLYADTLETSFVTMFLLCLDMEEHSFHYLGAGHDSFLVRADGEVQHLPSLDIPLGMIPGIDFQASETIAVQPDDTVLLVTDGIVEVSRAKDEMFGKDRLVDLVRENRHLAPAALLKRIKLTAKEFARHRPFTDDVTVTLIRRNPDPPE